MSVTRQADEWDFSAAQLLRLRIFKGSPDPAINYAPDTRYDAAKRMNVIGPQTLHIAQVLRNHADLWAHDRREGTRLELGADGKALWDLHMREADEEIARYLASHTLGRGTV